MSNVLKELEGFSGSSIFLIQEDTRIFVRKINNIERNFERLTFLESQGFPVPKIYNKTDNQLDLEYIHGLDTKNYLKTRTPDHLIKFIEEIIIKLSQNSVEKDYTDTYHSNLKEITLHPLMPFSIDDLIDNLPKKLPQSVYHGDLTLENILYSDLDEFYLIDAVTTNYDSWVFDIAKMRQDLECKWFIRKEHLKLDIKLEYIQDTILKKFPLADNNYLLILMLLRVWRYTTPKTKEQKFILENIIRLWK
jgi:RIO-like serine/threonine protein kinase